MNNLMFIVPVVVLLLLSLPFIRVKKDIQTKKEAKIRFLCNLAVFAVICIAGVSFALGGFSLPVGAEGTATAQVEQIANAAIQGTAAQGMGFLAAALVTGMAAIGAGIAVAAAAPAAIGAVSEDAKAFGKAIIFVVLGEGIAIYGLLISILIINKL